MKKIAIETIAAMCHQANHEFCKANGEKSLHRYWEDETQEEKDVSINALKEFIKLGTPYILQSNELQIANEAWVRWKIEKTKAGWVYGKVKDRDKKTHPCLVDDYLTLSTYEKVKDQIYTSILKLMVQYYEVTV